MVRHLPLEPLLPWIRRRALQLEEFTGDQGQKALGRLFAARFGGEPASAARQIGRMLNGEYRTVTEEIADRWCAFLDLHIDIVWPVEQEAA